MLPIICKTQILVHCVTKTYPICVTLLCVTTQCSEGTISNQLSLLNMYLLDIQITVTYLSLPTKWTLMFCRGPLCKRRSWICYVSHCFSFPSSTSIRVFPTEMQHTLSFSFLGAACYMLHVLMKWHLWSRMYTVSKRTAVKMPELLHSLNRAQLWHTVGVLLSVLPLLEI